MTRCLIVDDEKSIRLTLSEFLKEAGYEVMTAEYAEQALRLLDENEIDIVVTDIILPRINGIELMGRIRKSNPNIKIIMITGEPTVETAAEAVRAGAFDYLAKPVSQSAICKVVGSAKALKEAEEAKERLEEENQKYREHLEELVQERTLQVYQKEAYYRALIENAPDLIMVVNTEGKIAFTSPSFKRTLGYSRNELMEKNTFDFVHEDDLPVVTQAFAEVIENPSKPKTKIHRAKHKNGTWLYLETTSTNLLENPEVKGVIINARDITEKKKAEEALVESERKYRTHFENASDVVYSIDRQGLIRTLSPSVKRVLGYDAEELLGKPFVELNLLTPKSLERGIEDTLRVFNGETIESAEYTFINKEGQQQIGEVSSAPLYENGEIISTISVARDITERKRAEEEHEKLITLIESNSDFIGIATLQGDVLYVNEAAQKLVGLESLEEAKKKKIFDFVNDEVKLKMAEEYLPQAFEEGSCTGETSIRHFISGDLTDIEFTVFLIHSPETREPTNIAVIIRDITERKAAEDAYRSLAENTLQGIAIYQNDRIVFVNNALSDKTGYTIEELYKGTPEMLVNMIHPDDRDKVWQNYHDRIEGKAIPETYELRVLRKDGETRWIEIFASRIDYRGAPADQVIYYDVTDRKKAEEEKTKLEAQLAQSQKMEAIGRLAGGLAHDFNNLLTGIQGYAEMIQQTLKGGDPLLGDLDEIIKASDRASALTQQLLAFSRKQPVEPKILSLNEQIANSEKMLARLIGEDVEFIFKPDRTIKSIKADPNQIDQILFNLAVNARDAMPGGGKLIVETGHIDFDTESIGSNPDLEPKEYVVLLVSDTGTGMDSETQKHIFEPFYTTKVIGKGTGLGLSTVYGIVRQNKGAISVYSEEGFGTTFKIYLPLVKEDGPVEKVKEKAEPKGGKETILLVEDEEMVLNLAKKILIRSGYKVIEANRGGDAYFLCEKYKDEIHLLLTDVIMPNMNGKELYEKLQTVKPGLKALFMSGYTEDIIAHSGVVEEGTHFLRKPFTIKELKAKVREVLDS